MGEIQLIAMDLDGTLLTTDKRLTERNRNAMEKAAEAGIFIVPATGRIYTGLPEEIRDLSFIRYLILANGQISFTPNGAETPSVLSIASRTMRGPPAS